MAEHEEGNYYYVTAVDGRRVYFICGPFATKQAARKRVSIVQDYVAGKDGRADFMAWGVSRSSARRLRCPLRWGSTGIEVVPAVDFH